MIEKSPYASVLEDVDWLWNDWWVGESDTLTDGDLRRASAALHLLLTDGLLGKAWRHYGFERQPKLIGPDIEALAAEHELRFDLCVGCVAGGGRQNGIDAAFVGAFRTDNASTGVPADAEEGFAITTTTIARLATDDPSPGPDDSYVDRLWYVSEYLEAPGAVRMGALITRREVIKYFRNYVGGAHHDLIKQASHADEDRYRLIADLEDRIRADIRDGLYFELLSIGQSVARSTDVRALAEKIRTDPATHG